MALPVLSNDKPMYEVIIPSSQETFKFRPFLVKEQKSFKIHGLEKLKKMQKSMIVLFQL